MADDKSKQLFLSLIYSFQMQAMMQLGKLTNPMTNKTETELDGAQVTIDMLDMLKAKAKGNLADDESRFLDQVIADLKLNYVEERDKETKAASKKEEIAPDAEKKMDEDKPEKNEEDKASGDTEEKAPKKDVSEKEKKNDGKSKKSDEEKK